MRNATFVTIVITAILLTFLSACALSPRPPTHTPPTMQAVATPMAITTATNPYSNRSEEELAALIVDTAGQIEDIFESTILATGTVIAGDGLTDEIRSELPLTLQTIKKERSSFEQAVRMYNERFTALSPDSGSQITTIADEFDTASTSIDDLISEIGSDSEIDPDTIDKLEEIWAKLDFASNVRAWQEQVLTQIDLRETYYMNIQPQLGHVAYNRVEAFIQAHDYVQAVQDAFDDGIFTPEELIKISQTAANAEASLFNTGDPQLFGYAQTIDRLTRNIVRGDWANASDEIEHLRLSLPARPQP
jgi:hypothetical protein